MEKFNQLVIWESTLIRSDEVEDFHKFLLEEFNVRSQFLETVLTLPDSKPDSGGRSDIFFKIHDDDVSRFAIPRFKLGNCRWWEDVLSNGGDRLYHTDILKKYPRKW